METVHSMQQEIWQKTGRALFQRFTDLVYFFLPIPLMVDSYTFLYGLKENFL